MLCATFQIAILVPRSPGENQCTMTRPEGGHPIPWNQPFNSNNVNMMATELVAMGAVGSMAEGPGGELWIGSFGGVARIKGLASSL